MSDFHKKISLLSNTEKIELAKIVLDYKRTILPVLHNTPMWGNNEDRLFSKGLYLASSMPNARTFCLSAHRYKQAKKKANGLEKILDILLSALPVIDANSSQTESVIARTLTNVSHSKDCTATVDMPRHFSDYKHMLPTNLREEGEQIADLYAQMTDTANILEALCNDGSSLKKDRAFFAEKLCHIEDRIRNLWARIDVAYAEAVGKKVSEDYKFSLETERKSFLDNKEVVLATMTKCEIEAITDVEQKARAKDARIARDKKFLRKSDRKDSDNHRQNLMEAAKELYEWGILLTSKQISVCKMFGIDIPIEWQQKSTTDKKRERQTERNSLRKKERAEARAKANEIKEEIEHDVKKPYQQEGLSLFNKDV